MENNPPNNDAFLRAINDLMEMTIDSHPRWSVERIYVEQNLDNINTLRINNPRVTFEMLCEHFAKLGGPKLDPVKLQNALYRVNAERGKKNILQHFSNENGKGKRRRPHR